MKTKIKKNLIILLATLFLFAYFVLSALPLTYANAGGETIYTDVMDDLQKDEKFNTDDYPAVKDDYSLKVIQIAESSAKELFVYTYQPAHDTRDLIATYINISVDKGRSYWVYSLKLLSTNGVFDKYLVKDFKVSAEEERTYDISNIYRAWDKDIDNATGNDNIISNVPNAVGLRIVVQAVDGQLSYTLSDTGFVVVTSKYVDFVRYANGLWWLGTWTCTATDSHYIAFSVDKDIDTILSAQVYFTTRTDYSYSGGIYGGSVFVDFDTSIRSVSFDINSTGTNEPSLFGKEYKYSRILSVDDFISNETYLNETTIENIKNKDWVFRFYETEYWDEYVDSLQYHKKEYTHVDDVSVLCLEFETDGVVYNLGVVDNMQKGDDVPGNTKPKHVCIIWDLLKVILILAVVGWSINLIAPWIYPLLGKLIKGLFIVIWYIVSFKWLRDLLRWKKGKQPQQVVVVNSTNNAKRKRKGKKKPPTK